MTVTYYFDIGNSRGKFWRCQEGRINCHVAIFHEGNIRGLIKQLPSEFAAVPERLCGASVLGATADLDLELACKDAWGILPSLARSSASFRGIVNGYSAPEWLGVDRWLALLGVGAATHSACVVDCGTALTVDVIKRGIHSGGYILPGLSLMLDVLRSRTGCIQAACERLPGSMAALSPGRNTTDAVCHGVLLASVSVIERVLIDEAVAHLILTGGDADKLSPHMSRPHVVDPDLLLKGLRAYFGDPVPT